MLRLFAVALIAQLALMSPTLGGMAHDRAVDSVELICSSHADGAEVRAALVELQAAVGHGRAKAHDGPAPHDPAPHDPAPHDHDEHCPACALAKAMALPEASSIPGFAVLHLVRVAARIDRASPRQTAGPPVGLRAPPLTV